MPDTAPTELAKAILAHHAAVFAPEGSALPAQPMPAAYSGPRYWTMLARAAPNSRWMMA